MFSLLDMTSDNEGESAPPQGDGSDKKEEREKALVEAGLSRNGQGTNGDVVEEAITQGSEELEDEEMEIEYLVGEDEFHNEMSGMKERMEEMQDSFSSIRNRISDLREEVTSTASDVTTFQENLKALTETIDDLAELKQDKKSINRLHKDIERVSEKVNLMMEEVGYGEEIDVAKIPPNILEVVFQSTLDDVVSKIWRDLGSHDAERVIDETLEEVRLRTSGSELFYSTSKRIKTRNLASSLEKELISARQIQTTYQELLNKLLENLPGYKPKNFRAMIKIKSQEYAVDTSTTLKRKTERMSNKMNSMTSMLSSITNTLDNIRDDLDRRLDEMGTQLRQEQARAFEKQRAFFEDTLEEYKKESMENLEDIRREMVTFKGKQEEEQSRLIKAIEELKARSFEPEPDPDEVELDEGQKAIMDAVTEEMTLTKLKSTLADEIDPDDLEEMVHELMDEGLLEMEKKGRWNKVRPIEKGDSRGKDEERPATAGEEEVEDAQEGTEDEEGPESGDADETSEEDGEDEEAEEEISAVELSPEDIDEDAEKLTLDSMDEIQQMVYDALPRKGSTQKSLAKSLSGRVKYMEVLKTLRTLLDSELVEVETKGRHTVFKKIKKEKK